MLNIFSSLLDVNKREIDRLQKIVDKINAESPKFKKYKTADFKKKTEEFKKRLAKGETLDDILPEAFALVREASWQALGLRHYDVQLMASISLFKGRIVEQKTGEGKTLSAIPALYLRALAGKGVHLVTVNDYLARRDAGWNGPTFELLGLTVGTIIQEGKSFVYDAKHNDTTHGDERLAHLKPSSRKEAYKSDVLYGTNNEFGFDYLRDNMVQTLDEMVQRSHYFAIVDEVDSILIDEARTPLIISAPDMEPTQKYFKFAELVAKLNPDTDFTLDEKARSASLTEHGITRVEKLLGIDNLYEKDWGTIHHIENALRAKTLYLKDRDYVVKDNQVTIVDEFTGRLMFGRRWSDGLHQAVEAKEGAQIQQESKTLATISFQNYFRMYDHLSGMTGTAATEADEFKKIYDLEVVVVPTHRDMTRKDNRDIIYKSIRGKYGAIVAEVEERHKNGQPILVGTTSIEKNEIVASFLKKKKIPFNILNAKNHESEAAIISDAGRFGAVTVATNMAGRGVDIILGGTPPDMPPGMDREKHQKGKAYKKWQEEHDKVIKAGGLHVLGTERHESRRIDNQLRGRAGRQGDPGSSKFYLSLEDDLMRIFGGEQIGSMMDRLKIPEDMPIENGLVSRAIEQAQGKVEAFNFDIRKRLVDFDDVANQQRDIVYKQRKKLLTSEDISGEIEEKLTEHIDHVVSSAQVDTKLDTEKILIGFMEVVPFDDKARVNIKKEIKDLEPEQIKEFLMGIVKQVTTAREKDLTPSVVRQIEKFGYLSAIDHLWMDHIDHIDSLRESVGLRAYGQRDPLIEFKNEAYDLFETLMIRIDEELVHRLFRISVSGPQPEVPASVMKTNIDKTDLTGLTPERIIPKESKISPLVAPPISFPAGEGMSTGSSAEPKKIGRNDPCWCGSGKKWKKCHYPQLPK